MTSPLSNFVAPLRKRAGMLRKKMRALVTRHRSPLEAAQIQAALQDLMRDPPSVLMMHSSLSACGYIRGGAETVISAIERRTQTLVMPTHTYCYPPGCGGEPPVFDPSVTPSRVGRITDVFWRQPGTLRSVHPSHSLAARGPTATEVVADHELCETPCGRGTPYERLIDLDAAVLMFGATMNTYTFFHTTEDTEDCPYLYYPQVYELRVVDNQGQVRTVPTRRQNMAVARRFQEMDDVLEAEGLLQRRRLGRGELLYLPSSRDVHTFLRHQLQKDSYYLVAHSARPDPTNVARSN
jgi:aminoglycoside 3-N-acetyltransferase